MKTVVVAMSGGVDSSVTAYLLKREGWNVIGLFMKNWEEEEEDALCPAALDYQDVVKVCERLQIPHYAVNFAKEYREEVFAHFLEEYKAGWTPNPDILCNREIKFKVLLNTARSLGADFLATGHYCRTDHIHLLKGKDPNKDQSYFLYTIHSEHLKQVLFPIGHLLKPAVRELAAEAGLITHDKKDSTGICFIGKRPFKEFLSHYLGTQPGFFETPDGKCVGEHDGIAYYTIGQRKGLKIGGAGDAWFVVAKDVARNVVVVVQGDDHPLLYHRALTATEASWVCDTPQFPLHCTAKIRYRQQEHSCVVERRDEKLWVVFDKPQKAITPRQSVVFYQGDICLGGAMIEKAYDI